MYTTMDFPWQEQLRAARAARLMKPKPAPPAKPVPSKTAPVGSREWAACLIKEFGNEQGAKFIAAELSYEDAIKEYRRARLADDGEAPPQRHGGGGMASRIQFAGGGLKVFGRKQK